MKILHLSFHVGCLNDIQYVFENLGHNIISRRCDLPFNITESIAMEYWNKNSKEFQSYDIIITSDTVAISYIFLLNLEILKPHLIILICNRFDYAMYQEKKFYEKMKIIRKNINKVTLIPYTQFEQIWCGINDIFLFENPINVIGKTSANKFVGHKIKSDFGELNKKYMSKPIEQTIFIQTYHNHIKFMDLSKFLKDNDISVAYGGYNYVSELIPYLGIVILPDAFSKYFMFEAIQNNIITFVPSQEFLLKLVVKEGGYFFNIEGSGGLLKKEWVNLCEFYKHPEAHIYFESFDDLIYKIKNITKKQIEDKKKWLKYYGEIIEKESLQKWKNIINKIEIYKSINN